VYANYSRQFFRELAGRAQCEVLPQDLPAKPTAVYRYDIRYRLPPS
jgi:hypothetical protein